MDDLNEHPGFATTIFVSWDTVAEYLDYFDEYDVQPVGEKASPEFQKMAFIEAQNWAILFKEYMGHTPDENQVIAKENEIIDSLQEHWSACNICLEKFDFESYVKSVNDWSHNGAQRPELFGNAPSPGKALETFTTDLGINFTVYQPFMIPYQECYYFLHDTLPEWNYEEIEPTDIVETLFGIQAMLGNEINISLAGWASKWKFEDELTSSIDLD